ncbi:MCE family protein [Tsukamurella paurometabola]|uniref:MCE family protein n=1 Tax=Tsukamurella paurometabola TaxID=2061 RepID=A0ABS5NFB6_TSUPA|nr:MCE family protein [Tsukamurella paurometabola]
MGAGVRSVPSRVLLALALTLALLIAATIAVEYGSANRHFSVFFTNSTGLYVGDHVKVLGVTVGTVDEITPRPEGIEVDISVARDQKLPATVGAAIVAPTLVTGRYVQLAPVYDGGPELSDGATVPIERTATPMEFDQTKKQLVELIDEVGPKSEDQQGSLNRFLDASAKTVDGNGRVLHDALNQLSRAAVTVNSSGDNIFATIRNLSTVTTALVSSDEQIRAFSRELAKFSGVLDDNRTELDTLIKSLNVTFERVTSLIEQNREKLKEDVVAANKITKLLVDRMDSIDQILHVAPTTVSNYYNIYDPIGNSLTGALVVPDAPDPRSLICALLTTVNAPPDSDCAAMTGRLLTNAASAIANPAQGGTPAPGPKPVAPSAAPTRPVSPPSGESASKPAPRPAAPKPSTSTANNSGEN